MISLRNVSYIYKSGTVALNNINLDILEGEVAVIIGKNGSGKTTLGNVIGHILKTKKGNILVDGERLKNNKEIRKKIGIVFQDPNNQIIFNKVYDDIAFTLNNIGIEKNKHQDIILKALEEVDMREYVDANPFELSLGQKQRIAIASVIACNPKYLILDEATSMLDYNGKKDVYDIIKKLKKKKIGIIFITNNMDEIVQTQADKLFIIDKGNIKKEIERKEILKNINVLKDIGLDIPFLIDIILLLKKNIICEEKEILEILRKKIHNEI